MTPTRLAAPAGPPPQRDTVGIAVSSNPFRGYRPLLNPAFCDLTTASSMSNLIIRNGALTWDYGWTRYQDSAPVAAPLPLGGRTTALPGGTAGNPTLVITYFPDFMVSGNEATIAVTANGTNGHGTMFYYPHSGTAQWTELADLDGGSPGFLTDATHVMDHAYYPYSYTTGAGAMPRGTLFVTNGVLDPTNARVAIYPATDAVHYASMATPAANPDMSSAAQFGCRSVAVYAEKVYAFNTLEGTLANRHQPQRLRWTRPGWTSYTSTVWSNTTTQGDLTGYQDLLFCPGDGVKALQLGRNLACYLSQGVVILRSTGQVRPAHSLVYWTAQRGLLGTRAVVDIGGGVHFGVFTDGFWFLTEDGTWKEAGIANENGLRYRKFTDYFFQVLSKPDAYRIQMGFDRERRLVYLTFPTKPFGTIIWNTWVYDIDLDEMYPQTNLTLGAVKQDASAYGFMEKGTTQTGTCFVHATHNGHVWEHTPSISTQDGNSVLFVWGTPPINQGFDFGVHTITEAWMDVNPHATATSLTYGILNRVGSTIFSPSQTTTSSVVREYVRFPMNVTDINFQHAFTGYHPVTVYRLGLRTQREGEAPR